MVEIKGYVWYRDRKLPITWERESRVYVYNVRQVLSDGEFFHLKERLFDDKVKKNEIEMIG